MKSVMKRAAVMVLAAAGVLVSAQAARAQETVTAKVPFAFVVGDVEMPAGDYIMTRDTRQPELIAITTPGGERAALVLSRPVASDRNDAPKLEFERIGKQVFLTQVNLGSGSAREIPVPAAEEAPRK
jgi:hypothetical protein